MTEDAALAIMKPVSLDYGRSTYGDTGSGEFWFQVVGGMLFLEVGPFPEFRVTRIGGLRRQRPNWKQGSPVGCR
jgi:hypothetical protein